MSENQFWFGFMSGLMFASLVYLVSFTLANNHQMRLLKDAVATGKTIDHETYYARYTTLSKMPK